MNFKFLLKIFVSFALMGYLIIQFDFAKSFMILSNANFFYFFLSVLCIILNYVISSIRWGYLIIPKFREKVENENDISTFSLIKLYFVGSFFNNFLPTSIGGDAYKIYRLGLVLKSNTHAFTATFMERLLGMIALVIFSIYGFLTFSEGAVNQSLTIILVLFLFGCFIFFLFLALYPKFNFFAVKLPKISKVLDKVHDSFMTYKNFPIVLIISFLASLLVQVFSVLSQYFLFNAVGVFPSLEFSFFAFPLIFLSGYALPSINGVGTQDYLYSQFFSLINVVVEVSLASSMLFHFSRLLTSLIGGIFYIIDKNKNENN